VLLNTSCWTAAQSVPVSETELNVLRQSSDLVASALGGSSTAALAIAKRLSEELSNENIDRFRAYEIYGKWILIAAENGDANAQQQYAQILSMYHDTAHRTRARFWARRALAQGFEAAAVTLRILDEQESEGDLGQR
jgi:hypothetical protein